MTSCTSQLDRLILFKSDSTSSIHTSCLLSPRFNARENKGHSWSSPFCARIVSGKTSISGKIKGMLKDCLGKRHQVVQSRNWILHVWVFATNSELSCDLSTEAPPLASFEIAPWSQANGSFESWNTKTQHVTQHVWAHVSGLICRFPSLWEGVFWSLPRCASFPSPGNSVDFLLGNKILP